MPNFCFPTGFRYDPSSPIQKEQNTFTITNKKAETIKFRL
jgi:hypothetical protein